MAQSRSTVLSLCRSLTLFSLLGLLLPVAVSPAEKPSGQPPERIRIAYSSISGNMAPLWVAYERGFLRKYGLDVQLIFIGGGSQTVQALIGGDVSLAQVAGAGVIQADLQGADLAMIAGVINTLTFHFYVDKTIASPDQLKGKAVGVTRYGSSTDFAMRYALEKYGLQPDKDVTILQLGTVPATLSALEAGKIQGAMLSVPTTLKAKKLGFSLLANLQMLGLEYQHTGLAVTRALIKSRPDLINNLLKAYVEAIHYFKTNPKDAQAIYQKYLKTDDPDILAETYGEIAMLIPEKPYPTLRGIDIMLRELSSKEPKAQTAKPEQFVNLTFVRELDKSGFIDRLYSSPQTVAGVKPLSSPAQTKDGSKTKTAPVDSKGATLKPAVTSGEKTNPIQPARAPGEMMEYTIKAGDTLSKLAGRFYGAPMKWQKIYEANTQSVKNPNYIYIGQVIKIPPA